MCEDICRLDSDLREQYAIYICLATHYKCLALSFGWQSKLQTGLELICEKLSAVNIKTSLKTIFVHRKCLANPFRYIVTRHCIRRDATLCATAVAYRYAEAQLED